MRKAVDILVFLAMAIGLVACTEVPIEDSSAPVTGFVCSVNWSEVEGGKPAGVMPWLSMISSRVANAQHFFWEDIYYTDERRDTVVSYSGEYQSAVFLSTEQKAWWVENLPLFLNDRYESLRDVYARLHRHTDEALAADFPGFERILSHDLDTVPQAPQIWCAPLRYTLEYGQVLPLEFKPKPLTQEVTFKVKVQAEENVEPFRLVGCISGVPTKVELLSGQLNTERTGQTLFDMYPSEEEEGVWVATVRVLGILTQEDGSLATGNGLLTLCAEIGPLHRHFIRTCNLSSYLVDDPLLIPTQTENLYTGGARKATIEINSPFIIRNEDALYPEHQEPMDEWKVPENSDTVPIIDGHEIPEDGDDPADDDPSDDDDPDDDDDPSDDDDPTDGDNPDEETENPDEDENA